MLTNIQVPSRYEAVVVSCFRASNNISSVSVSSIFRFLFRKCVFVLRVRSTVNPTGRRSTNACSHVHNPTRNKEKTDQKTLTTRTNKDSRKETFCRPATLRPALFTPIVLVTSLSTSRASQSVPLLQSLGRNYPVLLRQGRLPFAIGIFNVFTKSACVPCLTCNPATLLLSCLRVS